MNPRHQQPNVAVIAAESLTTIRQIGFRMGLDSQIDEEARNVQLVLDCPFCRKAIFYRGLLPHDDTPIGECPRCDLVFDFDPDEIYACLLRVQGLSA